MEQFRLLHRANAAKAASTEEEGRVPIPVEKIEYSHPSWSPNMPDRWDWVDQHIVPDKVTSVRDGRVNVEHNRKEVEKFEVGKMSIGLQRSKNEAEPFVTIRLVRVEDTSDVVAVRVHRSTPLTLVLQEYGKLLSWEGGLPRQFRHVAPKDGIPSPYIRGVVTAINDDSKTVGECDVRTGDELFVCVDDPVPASDPVFHSDGNALDELKGHNPHVQPSATSSQTALAFGGANHHYDMSALVWEQIEKSLGEGNCKIEDICFSKLLVCDRHNLGLGVARPHPDVLVSNLTKAIVKSNCGMLNTKALREVNLSANEINDDHLAGLLKAIEVHSMGGGCVQVLDLSSNCLSSDGGLKLAQCLKRKIWKPKHVDISLNSIGDFCAHEIASAIMECASLQVLYIRGNTFGRANLDIILKALRSLPHPLQHDLGVWAIAGSSPRPQCIWDGANQDFPAYFSHVRMLAQHQPTSNTTTTRSS